MQIPECRPQVLRDRIKELEAENELLRDVAGRAGAPLTDVRMAQALRNLREHYQRRRPED